MLLLSPDTYFIVSGDNNNYPLIQALDYTTDLRFRENQRLQEIIDCPITDNSIEMEIGKSFCYPEIEIALYFLIYYGLLT